ncbi:MAG TPA: transposase [Leptolyngbyaceae cyanobacterium]
MKRTVSIPVDLPHERFLPLMGNAAEIFNQHVDWALANGTYNKSKAHQDLYAALRLQYPDVPSALLQTVRDNALEAIKATKFKRTPRKKPTSGLRYDKRTMTLRGQQLTLSCIGKRVQIILDVPEYFREVFRTWEFCGATLTYTKKSKQFWVRLVFEKEDPVLQQGSVLGIDRGLYHIASTSDGRFFSGSKTRAVQRRYLYNRRKLQQKGTRSAKRRLKAMSGKEKRFMRDCNHRISKKLVQINGVSTYVLEDLSGIRNQRRNKKVNKWISSWSFYQLEQFLDYKTQAKGKQVKYVDARYTSQKCSRCKQRHSTNRHKSKFHCKTCGFKAHSDINSALNIRDDYILSATQTESVEQAAVNPPDVSTKNFG